MSSFNMTNEMKNYFDSLPMNIKQELTHSGFSATSLQNLKDIVAQMTEVGMTGNYKRKYKLSAHLTNKYCENVYNPTVQPDGKTEMGVPIPSTENTSYSKEYEEENER